ncbi:hypothetical protein F5X98DRAFT_382294 [Xylaria grammica]|nr:hypothetical protein F5X98DRAFT_382294 [Xylaria grammica]
MGRNKGDWEVLAGSVAAVYKAGISIDRRQYHKPSEKALRLLELPSYTFNLQNYWIQYEGDWPLTEGRLGNTTHACISDVAAGQPISKPGLYPIQSQLINSSEVTITCRSEVFDPRLRDMVHGHRVNGDQLYSSALKERLKVTGAYQAKGLDAVQITFSSQIGSIQKEHVKYMVVFGDGEMWRSEWRQCVSLVQDCIEHLTSSSLPGPMHRLLGSMVYNLFGTFVEYDEPYRGMQEVYLDRKMREASAKVRFVAEANDLFVYHPCWIDGLTRISSFVLIGTTLTPTDTVYISHRWKSTRIAVPKYHPAQQPPQVRPEIEQVAQDEYTQLSEINIIFSLIAQEVGVESEELGVNSLLSLSIAARVKNVLGLEVPSNLFLNSVSFGDLRNNLTEYYGAGTPSMEDGTTTNTSMASDTEEIPCNDAQLTQNGAETAIGLVVEANLLLRSNRSAAQRSVLFLFPDGAVVQAATHGCQLERLA